MMTIYRLPAEMELNRLNYSRANWI